MTYLSWITAVTIFTLFCREMLFPYACLYDSHVCICFLPNMAMILSVLQNSNFLALLPIVRQRIIDGFNPTARDLFEREFSFFDKVTSISGVLFPFPKEERRAGIKRYCLRFISFSCPKSVTFKK